MTRSLAPSVGSKAASAGRSMPGMVLSASFDIAISAPVLPPETAASARLPSPRRWPGPSSGLGAADRLARPVLGRDHVLAMDDLADRPAGPMAASSAPIAGLVAEQEEGEVVAPLVGELGAGEHHRGPTSPPIASIAIRGPLPTVASPFVCGPSYASGRGFHARYNGRRLRAEIVRQRSSPQFGHSWNWTGFSASWLRRMLRFEGEVFLLGTAILAPVRISGFGSGDEQGCRINGRPAAGLAA
jgi:hypothetical protein